MSKGGVFGIGKTSQQISKHARLKCLPGLVGERVVLQATGAGWAPWFPKDGQEGWVVAAGTLSLWILSNIHSSHGIALVSYARLCRVLKFCFIILLLFFLGGGRHSLLILLVLISKFK